MTPRFSVRTVPAFERAARKLAAQHPAEFPQLLAEAIEILGQDPHNVNRRYGILKLKNVRAGDGQYRLRLSRFRFRYDVTARVVELLYCGLRREDTYRGR